MNRARTLILLALACLAAAAAWGQDWRGPASLAVEVKGKPRGNVEGALVILRYQQMEPPAGPRPVLTDASGRAVVADLAPGVWEVEVSHEDFLSFVALVVLDGGRKPTVQASFLQASGSSLTPIRVKFTDGRGRTPSPSVPLPPEAAARLAARLPAPRPAEPPRVATRRAPEPVMPEPELRPLPATAQPAAEPSAPPLADETAPEPEPESPADEAAAPPAPPAPEPEPAPAAGEPTGEAMPEPAAPEPEPEPTAPPAPEAEPEPAEPEPAPEPAAPEAEPTEPPATPSEPPTPPATPSEPVAPQPPPAPPEVRPAQPLPSPAPPPSAPAEGPAPPASEPAPSAPEPPAPEPSVAAPAASSTAPSPTPEPPAPAAVLPPPGPLGPTLRAYRDRTCIECRPGEWALSVETVVGPGTKACDAAALAADGARLAELLGGSIALELKEIAAPAPQAVAQMEPGEDATRAAELLGDASSGCRIVAMVIPKAGRFRGLRMEAADTSGVGDCQADRPCPVGKARWLGQPRVARQPSANVIWGLFVNEAPDRGRRARLTVYFAAPSRTWDPPR